MEEKEHPDGIDPTELFAVSRGVLLWQAHDEMDRLAAERDFCLEEAAASENDDQWVDASRAAADRHGDGQARTDEHNARQMRIQQSPGLAELDALVGQRESIDRQIRRLVCLLREWGDPAPSLATIAAVLGASPSGVRTLYSDDDRTTITEILGRSPKSSRDPVIPIIEPPVGDPDGIVLGEGTSGEQITLPFDSTVLIDIALDHIALPRLWAVIAHQVAHRLLAATQNAEISTPDVPNGTAGDLIRWSLLTAYLQSDPETLSDHWSVPALSEGLVLGPTPVVRMVRSADRRAPLPTGVVLIGAVSPLVGTSDAALVITAPTRAHDWAWSITKPGGGTATFRLAALSEAWSSAVREQIGVGYQGALQQLTVDWQ